MPADDISERYLKKAIAEINELGDEVAKAAGGERVPVLGSGHPQAELMLVKHRARPAEVNEGVAFFGRSGQAILKSMQRLRVDPTALYGTNVLKYEGQSEEEAREFLLRELHVVQPKLLVVMGQDARACVNALRFPLAATLEDLPGEIQRFTPTIDGLATPDVDDSLDDQPAKRAFWDAFRAIGPWWSEQPPY